jgi:hypothetical protein
LTGGTQEQELDMQRFLDGILGISIIIGIILVLNSWHYNKTYPNKKIDALFEPITSKYGVKIVYEIGDDFFSPLENPPIPAGPHRDSRVQPIRHQVLVRYPTILRKAFEKYPVATIRKYLKAIYFAGEVDHDGLMYGGTYDPFRKIIYLVDDGGKNSDEAISTFHHEFSSLLLNGNSFWIDPWTDNNPKDFIYIDDKYNNWKEVEKASNSYTDTDCYLKGFVTEYGVTNFVLKTILMNILQ